MASDMSMAIRAVEARIEADAAALDKPRAAIDSVDAAADSGQTAGFADHLRDTIRSVDTQERVAADKMAAVDAGQSDDLVGAMLASQQASLSFSMLMQARNKVVGALDELIKLQL
jgi:flagellar hook-basal body complex protein FliE